MATTMHAMVPADVPPPLECAGEVFVGKGDSGVVSPDDAEMAEDTEGGFVLLAMLPAANVDEDVADEASLILR